MILLQKGKIEEMTFEELINRLNIYWSSQGCAILQPYDVEVGAGTMHPASTLRALGPEDWNVAYVQPSRRPADSRYTRNPMRSQRYYQYQVILKPSPDNVVDLYMGSLEALGLDTTKNDIRLVEDDWEAIAQGAAGVGWEVWLDGTEITQFTFFQQMGGYECNPVCAEITYGPERLVLRLNHENSFWTDLQWNDELSYYRENWQLEMQHSVYNFEVASIDVLFQLFEIYEKESKRIIETPVFWDFENGVMSSIDSLKAGQCSEKDLTRSTQRNTIKSNAITSNVKSNPYDPKTHGPLALVYPAFDFALKCSHAFNVLDARGAIGATERASYINRIRARIRACCGKYLDQYKSLN